MRKRICYINSKTKESASVYSYHLLVH